MEYCHNIRFRGRRHALQVGVIPVVDCACELERESEQRAWKLDDHHTQNEIRETELLFVLLKKNAGLSICMGIKMPEVVFEATSVMAKEERTV